MTVTNKPFFCVAHGQAGSCVQQPLPRSQYAQHQNLFNSQDIFIHSQSRLACLGRLLSCTLRRTGSHSRSARRARFKPARGHAAAPAYFNSNSARRQNVACTHTQRHGHIYELVYVSLQCAGLFISGGAAPLRHAVPLLLHRVSALTASCTRPRWDKPKGPSVG